MRYFIVFVLCLAGVISTMVAHAAPALLPAVEAEYQVYEPGNAQNGAGPMWCYGSTCLTMKDAWGNTNRVNEVTT